MDGACRLSHAARNDDVPRYKSDMLVAETAQCRDRFVKRRQERFIMLLALDVSTNVGDGLYVFKEPGVWAWHVLAHLCVEAVAARMVDGQHGIAKL